MPASHCGTRRVAAARALFRHAIAPLRRHSFKAGTPSDESCSKACIVVGQKCISQDVAGEKQVMPLARVAPSARLPVKVCMFPDM